MGLAEIGTTYGYGEFSRVTYDARKPEIDGSFFEKEQKAKAPYSELAENGTIQYKGVVFVCDDENQALCLGDVSDEKNVLRIPLEEGGCLKVNRANIGDLSRAITRKINEIDELEDTVAQTTAEGDVVVQNE